MAWLASGEIHFELGPFASHGPLDAGAMGHPSFITIEFGPGALASAL